MRTCIRSSAALALVLAAASLGCTARGETDDVIIIEAPADAAVEAVADATPDVKSDVAPGEAGPEADAKADGHDAAQEQKDAADAKEADPDAPPDVVCPSGFKSCGGNCVSIDEPAWGCATTGCEPCALAHATAACHNNACTIQICDENFSDCNTNPSDGCEVDLLTSAQNCGACGEYCNLPNATAGCANGTCTIVSCNTGFKNCDPSTNNGCEANTQLDPSHCGECNVLCQPVGSSACTNGACQLTGCPTGKGDCDKDPDNGCEVDLLTTLANCGFCGNACSLVHATSTCNNGVCEVLSCETGYSNCDGLHSTGCEVETGTSTLNCGACSAPCSDVNNGSRACANGLCSYVCTLGYADCNGPQPGPTDDGCEVWVGGDVQNCGGCGKVCANPHGSVNCNNGVCVPVCASGWFNCNNDVTDGCETAITTVTNCGACGVACTNLNGTTSCTNGQCAPVCSGGFSDCDGNANNGCETATGTDAANCGSCNVVCGNPHGTTVCTAGQCVPTCASGFGDCDSNPKNGCEADIATSIINCGACGAPCSTANNSAPACASGLCSYVCIAGYADCNGPQPGLNDDGCEKWIAGDTDNCGSCGKTCVNPHGAVACSAGVCTPTCAAGWKDCNANASDGCETPVDTVVNCGNCGVACTNQHGTTSCSNGVCAPVCDNGYTSCDGNPNNGCEVATGTDVNSCGGCNIKCSNAHGTTSCVGGVCTPGCASGFGDCDSDPNNGCEQDTATNVANCGACNAPCSSANNSSRACANGLCSYVCNTGYTDCNGPQPGNSDDGCEKNTAGDVLNCGGCGKTCTNAHGNTDCVSSACVPSCATGWSDCNNNPGDGCETSVTTVSNCGTCGVACTNLHGTTSCSNGLCVPVCDTGFTNCDGDANNGCEQGSSSDPNNCGGCGIKCINEHGTTACVGGLCVPVCSTGFDNCDGDPKNGCEQDISTSILSCGSCNAPCSNANNWAQACVSGQCAYVCKVGFTDCNGPQPGASDDGCEKATATDVLNCGGCGKTCTNAHGGTVCADGVCVPTCAAGWKDCNANVNDGCETSIETVANCGTCGVACANAHGTTSCVNGLCAPACANGFSNCDGDLNNGCESGTASDPNNCGGCNVKCTNAHGTTTCVAGVCTPACASGYADCNGDPKDGCEQDTATSVASCGACNAPCSTSHATAPACSNGMCTYVCATGYTDCNGPQPGNIDDGCEKQTSADVLNCGGCGLVCSNAHGTTSCVNGACVPSCASGYKDCNSNLSDGCETAVDTTSNCGSCGVVCVNPHGTTACVSGQCAPSCASGFASCDADPNDGCETPTAADPNNCGGCNVKCTNAHGTTSCVAGACVPVCASGFGDCNGNLNDGCEADIATSVANCGACNAACSTSHATPACSGGLCTYVCAGGYTDCNGPQPGNIDDGCEKATATDVANCGGCGNVCTNANGTTSCVGGTCVPGCTQGFKDCNGNPADGCETAITTVTNCGNCGVACTNGHGSTTCTLGACAPVCASGFADCDGNVGNGCETPTASDSNNCGACGVKCSNTQGTTACVAGVCVPACAVGFGDCNNNPLDGCEADIATSIANCGACNAPCSTAFNGSRACGNGLCTYVCASGYADCNGPQSGAIDDGCETWTAGDVSSCGACGNVCSNPHGSVACTLGSCVPTCATGWKDCNSIASDGCETDVGTVANCGACGVGCTNLHGTTSCASGMCAPVCASGYSNCDGNLNNGCETPTSTDPNNCGGCNVKCANTHGTTACVGGACVPDCATGWGDCNANPNDGCESDVATSTSNCGACTAPCSTLNNGSRACESGLCSYVCAPGYTDCNGPQSGVIDDGCEAYTAGDVFNCGVCGKTCTNAHGGTQCLAGACTPQCTAGWEDCNTNPGDGCETSVYSVTNCGDCGVACTNAHGSTACPAGVCVPTCNTGYADCNANVSDGCETSTTSDPDNCGGCGVKCVNAHGTTACNAGACVPTCAAGWGDCDGNAANGCEVDLDTNHESCGTCGHSCTAANSTTVCSLGACAIVGCNSGYYDIDKNPATGCEYACAFKGVETCDGTDEDCDGTADEDWNKQTDPNNCGTCGNVCGSSTGGLCCAGVCKISDSNNCGACGQKCNDVKLVINEIMVNPKTPLADTLAEWFEVYNPSAFEVDIRGFVISDTGTDTHTINSPVPIKVPAGGLIVLGNNATTSTNGNVTVAYQYSSFQLGNSNGDEIIITAHGVELDRFVYPTSFASPEGKAYELSINHRTSALNDSSANWCAATVLYTTANYGTPNATNTCAK